MNVCLLAVSAILTIVRFSYATKTGRYKILTRLGLYNKDTSASYLL